MNTHVGLLLLHSVLEMEAHGGSAGNCVQTSQPEPILTWIPSTCSSLCSCVPACLRVATILHLVTDPVSKIIVS